MSSALRDLPMMPWGMWFRAHIGSIIKAFPIAAVVGVEARDLYYRGAWDVASVPTSHFSSGDIILLSNRWWALPTFSQSACSLATKLFLKTVWDDLGVVVKGDDGVPKIILMEHKEYKCMPLAEFLETRHPRGAAWRKLNSASGKVVAGDMVEEKAHELATSTDIPHKPWAHIYDAAWRKDHEDRFFNFAVEISLFEKKIRTDASFINKTHASIEIDARRREELLQYKNALAQAYPPPKPFVLHNASLAASVLASMGLLNRTLPPLTKYSVGDFINFIPSTNGHYDNPLVVYRG